MPLSRRYTRSRRVRKARRVTRYARRRAARTRYRRPYASRVSKRRSTRRVLNITSTKKRDNLMLYDPSNTTNTFQTVTVGSTKAFLFCPTYRLQHDNHLGWDRDSTTVFMKGYREHVQLSTNDGSSYKWRRIVFESKGQRPTNTDVAVFTSDGYKRLWKPMSTTTFNDLTDFLFAGKEGKDWGNAFMARVDTSQYKLHYDKTVTISSGNANGVERNYYHYFPFNRNMTYTDDEGGLSDAYSGWAALGGRGMGDIFVLDYFVDVGGTPGASLAIRSSSTVYWHEK